MFSSLERPNDFGTNNCFMCLVVFVQNADTVTATSFGQCANIRFRVVDGFPLVDDAICQSTRREMSAADILKDREVDNLIVMKLPFLAVVAD